MKSLIAVALLALTLTTGFTCSKNTPEAAKTETSGQENSANQPSQEQMAQPPADGSSAQPAEAGATPAPTETETK